MGSARGTLLKARRKMATMKQGRERTTNAAGNLDRTVAEVLAQHQPLSPPPVDRRARWGDDVPGGFARISAGIEDTDDLVADVRRALDGH